MITYDDLVEAVPIRSMLDYFNDSHQGDIMSLSQEQNPYIPSDYRKRLTVMNQKELDIRFTHHPPKGDQAERYARIRASAKEFANLLLNSLPESREMSIAFSKLEECVFWANAAIARRETFAPHPQPETS